MFTHRLALALRPVDTTSGAQVSGRSLTVLIDGKPVRFGDKGGILIFQQLEKRQFRLEIRSPYYETETRQVDLDALPAAMPLLELPLIPSTGYPGHTEFLTLEGTLAGIRQLTAVRAGDNACMIREFDTRKRMMKLFNPHHLSLDRVCYGLVDPDAGSYEPFRIVKLIDNETVKIDRVLETAYRNYFPITPLVMGKCSEDGGYCLRVRDEYEQARWIVRWEGETPCFQTVDFRQEPRPRLKGGDP